MFDPEVLQDLIRWGLTYSLALALAMGRFLGIALIFPTFTRFQIQGILRTGIVITIALPAVPYVVDQLVVYGPMNEWLLVGLILKEIFIGLMLGLALSLPFWGAIAAGDLIDFQRGSMMGMTIDPSFTTEASATANLLFLLMVTLFAATNGFFMIVDVLYQSFTVWPITSLGPSLTTDAAKFFIDIMGQILQIAFILAAPIVLIIFLADATLAFLQRYAPQLNIFELSLAIKSAVFVVILPFYMVFLYDFLERDIADIRVIVEELMDLDE